MATKKTNFINSFLVGCDPEIMALKDGVGVPVNSILPFAGKLGVDHNGRVFEVRPEPQKGTYTLIKNIQKIIKDSPKGLLDYKWRSGAVAPTTTGVQTLGGHVWIDLNPHNEMHKSRMAALDRITDVLERLEVLPRAECIRRRHGTYGKWGDYRCSCCHDGKSTTRPRFEYRTMASWLYHPVAAYVCLTTAKVAASDPEGSKILRPEEADFKMLKNWLDQYKGKDKNVDRLREKLLEKGIKAIQHDPDNDVKEVWAGKLSF